LFLAGGTYQGVIGCSGIIGTYVVDGPSLQLEFPSHTGRIWCGNAVDPTVILLITEQLFENISSYRIIDENLEFLDPNGAVILSFHALLPHCVGFSSLQSGPNPRFEDGHRFAVFDEANNLTATTQIVTRPLPSSPQGSVEYTGLEVADRLVITLVAPVSSFTLQVAHIVDDDARIGRVRVLDSFGGLINDEGFDFGPGSTEHYGFSGQDIARIEIVSPSDLVLGFCVEP
jgi:hypothetical protein